MELRYTNPLVSTLAHYELELEETLERHGVTATRNPARPVEGLSGLPGKAQMFANAALNIAKFRRGGSSNVQVWPSLGLLEARLWSNSNATPAMILHDPVPLRTQVGFSKLARRWASSANPSTAPLIIVHSSHAHREAAALLPHHRIVDALHPIRTTQELRPKTAAPSIVVAGQYKPERDLALLARLGPELSKRGIEAKILGRGWPEDLPGWKVSAGFIPDRELDSALAEAWAVLLPYNLYFQSGIAVRALQLGTPTVEKQTSFLADLAGEQRELACIDKDEGEELPRVLSALEALDAQSMFNAYARLVDESWARLLEDLLGPAAA